MLVATRAQVLRPQPDHCPMSVGAGWADRDELDQLHAQAYRGEDHGVVAPCAVAQAWR